MLAGARASRSAVVIGGGLLGLEAATGLLHRGMDVTVVHISGFIMNQQLDARMPVSCCARTSRAGGLKVCLSARTVSIQGTAQVTGVQLADGRELPADLVVMAHPACVRTPSWPGLRVCAVTAASWWMTPCRALIRRFMR